MEAQAFEKLRISELSVELRSLLLPIVGVQELADALLVSPRRVQQLTAEKVLVRAEDGAYPLPRSASRYVSWLAAGGDRSDITSKPLIACACAPVSRAHAPRCISDRSTSGWQTNRSDRNGASCSGPSGRTALFARSMP